MPESNEGQLDHSPSPDTKTESRRSFLKKAFSGLFLGAVELSPLKHLTPETTPSPQDQLTIIDVFSDVSQQDFLQEVLGDRYVDFSAATPDEKTQKIAAALHDPTTAPQALLQLYVQTFEYSRGALVHTDGEQEKLPHGELVSETNSFILEKAGYPPSEARHISLLDALTDLRTGIDTEGLPYLGGTIDEEILGQLLQNDPSPVINMSFQVGSWRLQLDELPQSRPDNYFDLGNGYFCLEEFDGVEESSSFTYGDEEEQAAPPPKPYQLQNGERIYLPIFTQEELLAQGFEFKERYARPQTTIVEAYSPENAADSFQRLIALCRRFPKKMFVGAAGNYNSFSAEQRQALEADWPENLILTGLSPASRIDETGFTEWQYLTNNISDIYFSDFGEHIISSSEATAVISALAAALKAKNPDLEPVKLRQVLIEACTKTQMVYGSQTIQIFDYQKAMEAVKAG